MNILFYPFYSQQNKETHQFILDKCCVARINGYLATTFIKSGHNVAIMVPRGIPIPEIQKVFPDGSLFKLDNIPADNLLQRLELPLSGIKHVIKTFEPDLIISHHELASVALRQLINTLPYRINLVQFNHLQPQGVWNWMKDLQIASWKAADLVITLSDLLAREVSKLTSGNLPISVWPMCYSEQEAAQNSSNFMSTYNRDIDILFGQRCSMNNYTHHSEFLDALLKLKTQGWEGSVAFTDPTGYAESFLKERIAEFEEGHINIIFVRADTREKYWKILGRTKYAIALMDQDLHGGIAIREAIRAGAVPILSHSPAYLDLTKDIPIEYLNKILVPMHIAPNLSQSICDVILGIGNLHRDVNLLGKLFRIILQESYEGSWNTAIKSLADNNLLAC